MRHLTKIAYVNQEMKRVVRIFSVHAPEMGSFQLGKAFSRVAAFYHGFLKYFIHFILLKTGALRGECHLQFHGRVCKGNAENETLWWLRPWWIASSESLAVDLSFVMCLNEVA